MLLKKAFSLSWTWKVISKTNTPKTKTQEPLDNEDLLENEDPLRNEDPRKRRPTRKTYNWLIWCAVVINGESLTNEELYDLKKGFNAPKKIMVNFLKKTNKQNKTKQKTKEKVLWPLNRRLSTASAKIWNTRQISANAPMCRLLLRFLRGSFCLKNTQIKHGRSW